VSSGLSLDIQSGAALCRLHLAVMFFTVASDIALTLMMYGLLHLPIFLVVAELLTLNR